MAQVKNKNILKNIAKDWARGILIATSMDSEFADEVLSPEEQDYIVSQVEKIAFKISNNAEVSLDEIISKYFTMEEY